MALTCDEIASLVGASGAGGKIRRITTAELAEDAFLKAERVKALEGVNRPLASYDERKAAFIELAEAREAATLASLKLTERTNRP